MNRLTIPRVATSLALTAALSAFPLLAWGGPKDDHGKHFKAQLDGFEEVPAISSEGGARFNATLNKAGTEIQYELSYSDLGSAVTQAHIHFGQKSVNGGVSVFLCSNLGNGPAGTQACPAAPATITGTLDAADVVGPTTQGIPAGDFAKLVEAIREGIAYANVHTTGYPGGEVRGQIKK